MNFYIMTLFPEMVEAVANASILGRAISGGKICVTAVNIRDFSTDKHKKVDDYPYGGGAGMVMQAQPIYDCYDFIRKGLDGTYRCVYLSPQGEVFTQKMAASFLEVENLILLCGHYEGVDERVIEEICDAQVSIGDYVLTGGELPALVMADAISRLVPGVLHNEDSAVTESFESGLLEYPQYSRPEVWHGREVPPILLSGDHAKVDAWRMEQALLRTKDRRPDLLIDNPE